MAVLMKIQRALAWLCCSTLVSAQLFLILFSYYLSQSTAAAPSTRALTLQAHVVLGVLQILDALWLIILYRSVPNDGTGRWQLSLADLLTATFFTGVFMLLARAQSGGGVVEYGDILVHLTFFILFLSSQLFAARNGCETFWLRLHYAVGLVLIHFAVANYFSRTALVITLFSVPVGSLIFSESTVVYGVVLTIGVLLYTWARRRLIKYQAVQASGEHVSG